MDVDQQVDAIPLRHKNVKQNNIIALSLEFTGNEQRIGQAFCLYIP